MLLSSCPVLDCLSDAGTDNVIRLWLHQDIFTGSQVCFPWGQNGGSSPRTFLKAKVNKQRNLSPELLS